MLGTRLSSIYLCAVWLIAQAGMRARSQINHVGGWDVAVCVLVDKWTQHEDCLTQFSQIVGSVEHISV